MLEPNFRVLNALHLCAAGIPKVDLECRIRINCPAFYASSKIMRQVFCAIGDQRHKALPAPIPAMDSICRKFVQSAYQALRQRPAQDSQARHKMNASAWSGMDCWRKRHAEQAIDRQQVCIHDICKPSGIGPALNHHPIYMSTVARYNCRQVI